MRLPKSQRKEGPDRAFGRGLNLAVAAKANSPRAARWSVYSHEQAVCYPVRRAGDSALSGCP